MSPAYEREACQASWRRVRAKRGPFLSVGEAKGEPLIAQPEWARWG